MSQDAKDKEKNTKKGKKLYTPQTQSQYTVNKQITLYIIHIISINTSKSYNYSIHIYVTLMQKPR